MILMRHFLVTLLLVSLIVNAAKGKKKKEPESKGSVTFSLTVLILMYLIYAYQETLYGYFLILLAHTKERYYDAGLSGSESYDGGNDDDTSKALTCLDLNDSEREEIRKMEEISDIPPVKGH